MSDLRVGMQIMHNGKPVELLYRTDALEGYGEIWKVKPLFLAEPDRTELFEPGEIVSFIHGAKKARAA